jgi:protein-S-isoprenylcysteine O-methyltransferase Ste14
MSTLNHHADKDYWLDSVYTAFVLSGLFGALVPETQLRTAGVLIKQSAFLGLYTGIFTLAVWSTSQKGVPWRKVVRTVTITT